jgi:hypothetical protein
MISIQLQAGRIVSMSLSGTARVSLQIFFSRYHLHAAGMFRDRVQALENIVSLPQEEREKAAMEHRSSCIACVISAASFIEALVNEAFDCAASPVETPLGKIVSTLPTKSRERIAEIWEFVSKPGVPSLVRLGHFVSRCGITPDTKAEPWVSARGLFELRNVLVHARPIDTGATRKRIEELETLFRKTFSDDDSLPYRTNRRFVESGNPFFPDKLLGHGCCSWAFDTATRLASWFATETKLKPWWSPG